MHAQFQWGKGRESEKKKGGRRYWAQSIQYPMMYWCQPQTTLVRTCCHRCYWAKISRKMKPMLHWGRWDPAHPPTLVARSTFLSGSQNMSSSCSLLFTYNDPSEESIAPRRLELGGTVEVLWCKLPILQSRTVSPGMSETCKGFHSWLEAEPLLVLGNPGRCLILCTI